MTRPGLSRSSPAMWLIAAACTAAAARSIFSHFLRHFADSMGAKAIILGATFGVCLPILWLLARIAWPALQKWSARRRIAWGVISLGIGVWIVAAVPIMPVEHYRLEIVATGQKNPAAVGSEVWIYGLGRIDGNAIPIEDCRLEGVWEINGSEALSHKNQPARLIWDGTLPALAEYSFEWAPASAPATLPAGAGGDSAGGWKRLARRGVVIRTLAHPWSGIVELRLGPVTQLVDLYSPTRSEREIELLIPSPAERSWSANPRALTVMITDSVSLGLLVFLAGIPLVGRVPRSRMAAGRPSQMPRAMLLLLVGAGGTMILWRLGLGNLAYEPGSLKVAAATTGGDVLPVELDAAGREVVDVPLNRYLHTGRCTLAGDQGGRRVALIGIIDEAGTWHPASELQTDNILKIVSLPGTSHEGAWMEREGFQSFSFTLPYEDARAVFYAPDGPVDIGITLDDVSGCRSLLPDAAGLAHFSLRPLRRTMDMREYEIRVPPVHVSQLTVAPLPETTAWRIGGVALRIPGVTDIEPSNMRGSGGSGASSGSLVLAGSVHYDWFTGLRSLGLFAIISGALALLVGVFIRMCGTADWRALIARPISWWEVPLLVATIGFSLWLQVAACGVVTNDGITYTCHALKFLTTGDITALTSAHPPAFSAFLAALFSLQAKGGTLWIAAAILLPMLIAASWYLGRRLGGRFAGLLTAVWMAANPVLLMASRAVLPDFLFSVVTILWFWLVLRWCVGESRRWGWGAAAAVTWVVLVMIRPNALSMVAMAVVVPFVQKGLPMQRALAGICLLAIGVGLLLALRQITRPAEPPPSLVGWGRLWPVGRQALIDTTSREFRPLRDLQMQSMTQIGSSPEQRLYLGIREMKKQNPHTDRILHEIVNAGLRRDTREAVSRFAGCLSSAYLIGPIQQTWAHLTWYYPTADGYRESIDSHAASANRMRGPEVAGYVASFATPHPEGSARWSVFRWLHAHCRSWRLWPMTILAVVGAAYAIARREGVLVLPLVASLVIAVPLCLMYVVYDRYFLPAELLLVLQAAVGLGVLTRSHARDAAPVIEGGR